MQAIFSSLLEMGASKNWLVTANLILSILLCLWMLRCRRLYLRAREEQLNGRDLIENLSEGVYRSTLDGRQISANRALVRLNGYASEAEQIAGVKDIAREWYVDPARRDEFRAILARDGVVEDFVSEIYRHKTRERIWITESARVVRDKTSGKPLFYEGSVREITETMKRLAVEEQFRKLTDQLPGALFQFVRHADGRHSIQYLSPGFWRILDLPADEPIATTRVFEACIHPDDRAEYYRSLNASAGSLDVWAHEFRIVGRGGGEKWLRVMAHAEAADGAVTWHGYLADISVRKKHEMEIEELAYFDPLTRLPNRRLFLKRMAEAIADCERRGDHGALLFIDLDNFKTLNDTQGHDVGDAFLNQVADRLRGCVDRCDTVARIGGDEFVIILDADGHDRAHTTRHAITRANRVLSALRNPFELGALRHVASASVGIVVFDGLEKRGDEILKCADIAMYEAKAAGRNGMALFDPATMDREAERYQLTGDLRAAFAGDQLVLHFQPQVDANGDVTGAEALLRWHHPTLGMVFPDQFVQLAEQFGLGHELGQFVLARGVETLAAWQRTPGHAGLGLAINISVQSFTTDDFVPGLKQLIEAHQVDATRLTLELTEHVMAKDQTQIARRMAELKRLGVRLSLDDFGTGYSSLTYLKKLPFDEVKIDGGFVADIENGESDRALVKTILAMARNLGLTAVAEHVENIRQQAFLRAFGCDFFQGYLYGKAVPEQRFLDLVAEHRNVARTDLQRSA
jgi:diguanylate cyclase (GGDEF)-like protein/PAS domain S-box-containing protein